MLNYWLTLKLKKFSRKQQGLRNCRSKTLYEEVYNLHILNNSIDFLTSIPSFLNSSLLISLLCWKPLPVFKIIWQFSTFVFILYFQTAFFLLSYHYVFIPYITKLVLLIFYFWIFSNFFKRLMINSFYVILDFFPK